MRELEYPYNSDYILLYKKKLKQELLKKNNLFEKKIAILSGSTITEVKDMMELFLLNQGIKPVFYESDYNRYYEELVFENDKLKNFNPDIIYIFTSSRNIIHDFSLETKEEIINQKLNELYNKYEEMWSAINNNYHSIIIQNNFEYPNYRLLGNKDISDVHGLSNFINRINNKFYEYAKQNNNFYICDINYVASDFGISKWHNEKSYALYKMPCDIKAMPDIAYNVSNIIKSIYGKNKKAIITDLDNTLWGGVVSEDGLSGIKVGPEVAEGELYLAFQNYLKKLKSQGIILNIVSKNDEDIALDAIEKSSGVLKDEDFIIKKINWNPKDDNIVEIIKELNLGSDAFIFIDDNPMEQDIVRSNIKDISVLNASSIEEFLKVLDKSQFFECTKVSEEDKNKTELYKDNLKRDLEKAKFATYEEYLDSLNMVAYVNSFEEKYYERISQLSNKSNQFNMTTKRYSIEDIKNIAESDDYITLYGRLVDKFGDNGIVSLVVGKKEANVLNIDLFLMSCRVLKRNLEYVMIDELVKNCVKKNITEIHGYYYKSAKNSMVKDLFKDFGFSLYKENENGDTEWVLKDLKNYKKVNRNMKVMNNNLD